MSGVNDALLFLITTVFELYLFILVIRVLLAYAGANYFDPMTQFIIRCTDFIVKPLRRIIPNIRRVEVSTVTLIIALEILKRFIISSLSMPELTLPGICVIALADTIRIFLQTLLYAIILQAIISWVQANSPVSFILDKITAPIMRPIQRVCPAVGGMDISPIPAIIILQLLIILIANPLAQAGYGVSLG